MCSLHLHPCAKRGCWPTRRQQGQESLLAAPCFGHFHPQFFLGGGVGKVRVVGYDKGRSGGGGGSHGCTLGRGQPGLVARFCLLGKLPLSGIPGGSLAVILFPGEGELAEVRAGRR